MFEFTPVPKPNHNRRVRKKKDRGEFPPDVRERIVRDQNGQCQICGRPTTYIHHIKPRGRGGRGVYTNGLLVCNNCHNPKIHDRPGGVEYWISVWESKHGPDFWKDENDK